MGYATWQGASNGREAITVNIQLLTHKKLRCELLVGLMQA